MLITRNRTSQQIVKLRSHLAFPASTLDLVQLSPLGVNFIAYVKLSSQHPHISFILFYYFYLKKNHIFYTKIFNSINIIS